MPKIRKKLEETHQTTNKKKTKIDTAYHGVPFLGKISYPYGYQKPNKQVIKRTVYRARNIIYTDADNLLAKTNSQIGSLKNYNCRKLIMCFAKNLPQKTQDILNFNADIKKFNKKETIL